MPSPSWGSGWCAKDRNQRPLGLQPSAGWQKLDHDRRRALVLGTEILKGLGFWSLGFRVDSKHAANTWFSKLQTLRKQEGIAAKH